MADPVIAVQRICRERTDQVGQLSRRSSNLDLSITHNRNSGGVITPVFEFAQSVNNRGNYGFRAYITYNSAHGFA
jgi:hypothetical protein